MRLSIKSRQVAGVTTLVVFIVAVAVSVTTSRRWRA